MHVKQANNSANKQPASITNWWETAGQEAFWAKNRKSRGAKRKKGKNSHDKRRNTTNTIPIYQLLITASDRLAAVERAVAVEEVETKFLSNKTAISHLLFKQKVARQQSVFQYFSKKDKIGKKEGKSNRREKRKKSRVKSVESVSLKSLSFQRGCRCFLEQRYRF